MVDLNTALLPRLQSQLIGHQTQWDFFIHKFLENKLHPAWLLAGSKGIGKATFAYQAVRAILKANQKNDSFFDTLISQKSHPNLLIIEQEFDEDGKGLNEITIESIRKIAHFVHQSSAFPGWRIVLIDGIDALNRNAANALLKILEEPPKQVLILLVCHSLGQILPTIRSRCCVMNFKGLNPDTLKKIFSPVPSLLALELSNNSIGKLFELQKIDLTTFLDQLIHVLHSVLKDKLAPLQQFVTSFDKTDPKATLVLDLLSWIARQLVLISSNVVHNNENSPELVSLTALRSSNHWLFVQEKLSSLIDQAKATHLDASTLYIAAFLCFDSPHLVQE